MAKNASYPHRLSDQQRTLLDHLGGRRAVRATKAAMHDLRRNLTANAVFFCENCRKSEREMGKKYLECISCRTKVNRKNTRGCQKRDWRSRHRDICGRFLTLETARRTAVSVLVDEESQKTNDISHPKMQIGAARNGFIRPLALKYVIHHINAYHTYQPHLNVEYILFRTSGDSYGLVIQNEGLRRTFRTYNIKAMTTGDKMAVGIVTQFIVSQAEVLGINRGEITAQLEREYEIDAEAEVKLLEGSDSEITRLEKIFRTAVEAKS